MSRMERWTDRHTDAVKRRDGIATIPHISVLRRDKKHLSNEVYQISASIQFSHLHLGDVAVRI